ncbi:hypothetical protein CCHR01_10475 [Colletotrichum chrysophilum]|uniref:Rhodopsin domain-containing protein n=1 Tax=Colletotrichum chrysophilum TaxID=1836956 RepID=A0AAD9AEZ1_9PEZI|nr:hypothetical protein CCHR01_10475 [Colletotrichum chrysophilum]
MYGNLTRAGEFPSHYTDEGLPLENRKSTIVGVIASGLVVAWFCVGLRIFVRVRIVRAPGWDDAVVLLALCPSAVLKTNRAVGTNYGLGHPFREVPDSDREMFFLLFYMSNASFSTSNALVKLSILLQYLRLFKDRMRNLRVATTVLIIIVSIWGFAFSFMAWFPCFPVQQFYRLGSESNCYGYGSTNSMEVYNVVVSSNATNMALDFIILVLPIPLLFSDDTIRRTKLGLMGLLFIGALINVIAGGRIVANRSTSDREPNPTKSFPTIILLGETENRLSLALASIPVFWPVVTKTWNNFIYVTREVKVESTSRDFSNQLELGRISPRDYHGGIARITTEDETTEAGLRHPGRLGEMDRYVRQLISPFAENQKDDSTTLTTELNRSFTEELEGHNLDFETMPEMARSRGPSMNVESRGPPIGAGGQKAGHDRFNVHNTENV